MPYSADTPAARGEGERTVNNSQGSGFCHAETGALLADEAAWERRELEEKANRDGTGECWSSRRVDEMATRCNTALLADGLHGISDSLVIGSPIREHGTKLGDSSVGVDFNLSGDPGVADIERRAAGLVGTVETIGGENPSSKIARFKALATTECEAGAMWTAKAAPQSGCPVTRLATRRLVAPATGGEALRATQPLASTAARLAIRKPRVGASYPVARPARGSPRRPPHRATPDAQEPRTPPLAGADRPTRRPPQRGPTRDDLDVRTQLPATPT